MKKILIIATGLLLASCSMNKSITGKVDACPIKWANSIHNPENKEYVEEVAFNENVKASRVTQEMFNNRYN